VALMRVKVQRPAGFVPAELHTTYFRHQALEAINQ
jgi:hypothetical protein